MERVWARTKSEIVESLKTNLQAGLSEDEASHRLAQYGPNRLVKERTISWWGVFREEITEPMIILLLVVGVVYAIWGELRDVITIFTVIVLLVFAEVFTEYRAKKSITALRKLSPQTTPVIRGGSYARIPSVDIMPGDLVPLEAGDHIPADGRVLDSFGLQIDESALTGESVAVNKDDTVLPDNVLTADRINMVFAGTIVTGGRGMAVITGTGMDTELGRVTSLVIEAKEPRTQLQQAMRDLAGLLVWVAVSFSVIIPLIGILQGKPYKDMILTGLSLSFATIPEELPIIITMVLGVGALSLSRKHVLIRRLKAAETLGGVTVIVTDKTGTITENKMTLTSLAAAGKPMIPPSRDMAKPELNLLEAAVLTSHLKRTSEGKFTGDPIEVAILYAAQAAGLNLEDIQSRNIPIKEFSFDNRRKMMSVIVKCSDGIYIYAKGAPEVIAARCSRIYQESVERDITSDDLHVLNGSAESMATEAMRVIAFGYRKVDGKRDMSQKEESNLTFLGQAGFADPPRIGVKEAIKATREAGIRTIIVSGDLPLTVQKVAAEVGINIESNVVTGAELGRLDEQTLTQKLKGAAAFARTDPAQKLQIVQSLQKSGEIVAVTGDGINDAPALKAADIGVAMGETGTEVAREAADMILTDDSFTSIVDGVREGRKIFDNLRKGLTYYLSVKIALVLTFVVPLALGLSFPFAPVQIVLLELFMDLAASATFVAEPMEPDTMRRPPCSPGAKFIDGELLSNLALGAVSLSVAVLFNYLYVWYNGQGLDEARSVAFGTWLVGHIFLAFTMRSQRVPLPRTGLLSNRVMLFWAAAAFAFLLFVMLVPSVHLALKVTFLSPFNWLLVIIVPAITIFWLELRKLKHK